MLGNSYCCKCQCVSEGEGLITEQPFSVSQSGIASWATALQVRLGSASVGNTCHAALHPSVQKDV